MALRALQGPTGGGTPVGGTGTTNTIPRWTGPSTLGDSALVQVGAGIGLGTASLFTQTFFQVAAAGGGGIVSQDTNGGGSFLRVLADTANQPLINWTTGSALRFATSTSAFGTLAEWMRITSTGNVGIGTTSPTAYAGYTTLAVNNATNGGLIEIQKAGAVVGYINGVSGMLFLATGANQATIGTAGAGSLVFRTNAADVARIDSAGRALWNKTGTPTGSGIAHVVGPRSGATAGGTEWIGSAGNGFALIQRSSGGADVYSFTGDVGAEAYTQIGLWDASSLNISLVSGYGLKLPATPGNADTQTLDAYQENTWTPTLSAAATWGGTAPTITSARYTRVGRTITCSVILAATGGAAYSSTWGSTTISAPFASGEYSVVPCAREAPGGSNGIQQTSTVYLPTTASSTAAYWITWTYQV